MIGNTVTILSTVSNYDIFSHNSTHIVTIELRFLVASIDKEQEFVNKAYITWMLISSVIEKFL
jgi:hypothetical protein